MKHLEDFIEHIKIESNCRALVYEKYGLFEGCDDIVSIVLNDIKDLHKKRNQNKCITIEYDYNDFEGIENVFFNKLIIIAKLCEKSGGEYSGKTNKLVDGKLNGVLLDIEYMDGEWRELEKILYHELTHAFEDYNRKLKDNIKTLGDLEDTTYVNALNNLETWDDSLEETKKLIGFYIYLSNPAELNAFIASFSAEIKRLDDYIDLSKDNVIKAAKIIISNTTSYKKYNELSHIISILNNVSIEKQNEIKAEYNRVTASNKTFNQIKKEMTYKMEKINQKINTVIPKIICDYIETHSINSEKNKIFL